MTGQEELIQLRKLVEEQKAALAQKDKLISAKEALISQKDELLSQKEETIQGKEALLAKLNIQIENLTQALLHARKKLFGPSTEVTPIDGQISLFESDQELAEELAKQQEKAAATKVKSYTRTPRKAGIRAEMLACLPKEVEEYVINPEETCSACGAPLKVVGKEVVRTEVEYVEAHLVVKQVVRQVAKCTKCGTEASQNPKDHFQKAAIPAKVLPHSIATHSLVAHVMYEKFALGVPLARLVKDFHRLGLEVQRATLAHWVIRCSEEWLEPIYWRIHEKLIGCEVLHMDETRIQCNREPGKKASSQSWMWVIQSAACESLKATFFYYSRSRSGDIPKDLLKGFHGYLTTDAYDGYEKVEGIQRNLCWSHVRRYLVESIPLDSKGKEIPGSKGAKGREYINLLFDLEDQMKELSAEERKEKRQVASRAMLDAFWSWVEETSQKRTTNEALVKALGYAKNQRKYLETFLEDGRLAISNNLCESHIRPFATARKSWLFADTPKGAFANGVLYTLAESAKQNDLNVFNYLDYLLDMMPNTDYLNHPELLDAFLPWSDQIPDSCRLTKIREVKKSSN